MKRILLIGMRVAVVGAILFFLGAYGYRNWTALNTMSFSFRPLPFALSTLLVLVLYAQQSNCWGWILGGVAKPVPWREAMAVWFASQVAKYVPGKMMLPLIRFGLCRRRGIDIGRTTVSIYLELALMTGSAIAVFLFSTLGWSDDAWILLAAKLGWSSGAGILRYLILLTLPAMLIGIHPRLLAWSINLGLRLLKKEPIALRLPYARLLLLLAGYIAGWIVYAGSCWLLMRSLGYAETDNAVGVSGIFLLAWIIGFLSFVTPGGIGVREAILTGMLALWNVPLGLSAAAAGLSRLQWTGMELVGAALTVRDRPEPLPDPAPAADAPR